MANDVSGFGLQIRVIADVTFPAGVTLTQFADDSDPLDIPSMQIADKAMGLNGDLVTWSVAKPISITVHLIPDSDDDINMQILFENNRVGQGKNNARDTITLNALYPSGKSIVLTNGRLTDGMPGTSAANSGKLKSKAYMFSFENKVGTN